MVPPGFPLTRERARELLETLREKRLAVLGDVHLDVYWDADMQAARLSRETPHHARPIVRERYDPGVGGVIAANLRALGAGEVYVVGACGDDWRGGVLRDRLVEMGVRLDAFRTVPGRITPTYIKPMLHGYESVQEDPRLDFQDRCDLPAEAEAALIEDLERLLPELDGIAAIDQIEEPAGGIVTATVRRALERLRAADVRLPLVADSRARIERFQGIPVKVNRLELSRALQDDVARDGETLLLQARALAERTREAVFVSEGRRGMTFVEGPGRDAPGGHVPAVAIEGPTDTVGAGDSASAGLVSALACGASFEEAMALANLAASVTVRKIGVTGTASPEEILAAFG